MKKLVKKLVSPALLLGLLLALLPVSHSSAQNPDDMVYKGPVTVWFWNQFYWQDQSGEIWKDTSTGLIWIKIHHAMTIKKAVVLSNRDYDGSIKGGQRTYREYCATPEGGLTYYFDIPDSYFQ